MPHLLESFRKQEQGGEVPQDKVNKGFWEVISELNGNLKFVRMPTEPVRDHSVSLDVASSEDQSKGSFCAPPQSELQTQESLTNVLCTTVSGDEVNWGRTAPEHAEGSSKPSELPADDSSATHAHVNSKAPNPNAQPFVPSAFAHPFVPNKFSPLQPHNTSTSPPNSRSSGKATPPSHNNSSLTPSSNGSPTPHPEKGKLYCELKGPVFLRGFGSADQWKEELERLERTSGPTGTVGKVEIISVDEVDVERRRCCVSALKEKMPILLSFHGCNINTRSNGTFTLIAEPVAQVFVGQLQFPSPPGSVANGSPSPSSAGSSPSPSQYQMSASLMSQAVEMISHITNCELISVCVHESKGCATVEVRESDVNYLLEWNRNLKVDVNAMDGSILIVPGDKIVIERKKRAVKKVQ